MQKKANSSYCHNEFQQSLQSINTLSGIRAAFKRLESEIQKLDSMTQTHLYSLSTQLILRIRKHSNNWPELAVPLDIFEDHTKSILDHKYNIPHYILMGIMVITIALTTLALGAAIGIGIGLLAGFWTTPLLFFTSLFALQLPAVLATTVTGLTTLGAASLSGILLFKTPSIRKSLARCIKEINDEGVKDSQTDSHTAR